MRRERRTSECQKPLANRVQETDVLEAAASEHDAWKPHAFSDRSGECCQRTVKASGNGRRREAPFTIADDSPSKGFPVRYGRFALPEHDRVACPAVELAGREFEYRKLTLPIV